MKGQMIFEFVIAAVLFFGIIVYAINILNVESSIYSSDYIIAELENKAMQVSELLMHDPGIWYGDVISAPGDVRADVIGLSNGWPVLNSTKIKLLRQYCLNDYNDLLDHLDTKMTTPFGDRNMKVVIEINETEVVPEKALIEPPNCGYEPINTTYARVDRIAITEDGDILRVVVGVWG